MRKFLVGLVAVGSIAVAAITTSSTAEAGYWVPGWGWDGGIAVGLALGASVPPPQPYYGYPCYAAYAYYYGPRYRYVRYRHVVN
jgi:hypothetical protein